MIRVPQWCQYPRLMEVYDCGNYRVTVNPVMKVRQFPVPTDEDLFGTLTGGPVSPNCTCLGHISKFFFTTDYVTMNTHKGLYQYNCLPFGVTSAPALFQEIMEKILQGLPHVVVYIDLLITGQDEQDHLQVLEQLVQCLEEYGLRLKLEKAGSCNHPMVTSCIVLTNGAYVLCQRKLLPFSKPLPLKWRRATVISGPSKLLWKVLKT